MTGLRGGDGIIVPGQYTLYGIDEMQIIACESNEGAWRWKLNVAKPGVLRTVKGTLSNLSIFTQQFVDEHGAR